jgi:hypothetical protein
MEEDSIDHSVRIESLDQLNQVGNLLKAYSKNKDPKLINQVEKLLLQKKGYRY